jgi:ATP-dependent helicase HrpB
VDTHDLARALALAFPDRVSRRRDASGETWQSVGGRGFRLDPASSLASNKWLAVGEVAGHASGARILSAAVISEEAVTALFADDIAVRHDGDFDKASGAVIPVRSRRLGAVRLSSGPDPKPDQTAIEQALLDGVRDHGLDLLPWNDQAQQLRERSLFTHRFDPTMIQLDDKTLIKRADVPQEARQDRLVQVVVVRGQLVRFQLQLRDDVGELSLQFLPLAHADEGQEVLAAPFAQLISR